MRNLKDRLLCLAKGKHPVAMMLRGRFVLDHVRKWHISTMESVTFLHSKAQ